MTASIITSKRRQLGTILAYSDSANSGVIQNQRGNRYYFDKSEWGHPDALPVPGESVTFERKSRRYQAKKVRRASK